MKKIALFFLLITIVFSCKKKKDETPTPEPQPSPVTPTVNKLMTAKINGLSWAMGNNAYSTSKSGGINITFSGKINYATTNNSILLNLGPNTGIYTFSTSPYGATYIDSSGTARGALASGTINITEIDTNQYGVKKLKATFGFVTIPSGGKTYSITEGVVDWTGN